MTGPSEANAVAIARAKAIAFLTISGDYDLLLACRELFDLRDELPAISDEIADVFASVSSEVDELPIGAERAGWNTDALEAKDKEAHDYRLQVGDTVREALWKLLEVLSGHKH